MDLLCVPQDSGEAACLGITMRLLDDLGTHQVEMSRAPHTASAYSHLFDD